MLMMMVFFSGFLLGQEVTVSARLDSSRALIGDQLTLHLRVEKSAGARVTFPRYADTLTGKIEIIRKSSIDTATGTAGKDQFLTRICLSPFSIPVLLKYHLCHLPFKTGSSATHFLPGQYPCRSVPFLWIQLSGISKPI